MGGWVRWCIPTLLEPEADDENILILKYMERPRAAHR